MDIQPKLLKGKIICKFCNGRFISNVDSHSHSHSSDSENIHLEIKEISRENGVGGVVVVSENPKKKLIINMN